VSQLAFAYLSLNADHVVIVVAVAVAVAEHLHDERMILDMIRYSFFLTGFIRSRILSWFSLIRVEMPAIFWEGFTQLADCIRGQLTRTRFMLIKPNITYFV